MHDFDQVVAGNTVMLGNFPYAATAFRIRGKVKTATLAPVTTTPFQELYSSLLESAPTQNQVRHAKETDLYARKLPKWLEEKLHTRPPVGARSEYIYNVIGNLKENGLTCEQVCQLALKHQNGFAEKLEGNAERITKEVTRCYSRTTTPTTHTATDFNAASAVTFMRRSQLSSLKPPSFLVEDWLPDDGLICITGEPGTGKTFLALDLAACLATGLPFMGKAVKPTQVLYITPEGRSGLDLRVKAWEKVHSLSVPDDRMAFCTQSLLLNTDDDHKALMRALEEIVQTEGCFGLVIIDTIARTMSGESCVLSPVTSYLPTRGKIKTASTKTESARKMLEAQFMEHRKLDRQAILVKLPVSTSNSAKEQLVTRLLKEMKDEGKISYTSCKDT